MEVSTTMQGFKAKIRVAAVVIISIWIGLAAIYGLVKPISNGCVMTYMYPQYIPISSPANVSSSKYGLYLYHEGWKKIDFNDHVKKLSGVPVLFIPGNGGSYKQVRSLAAESDRAYQGGPLERTFYQEASLTLKKGGVNMDAAGFGLPNHYISKLDWFAVDLEGEHSAMDGRILEEHTEYVVYAIHRILDQYKDSRDARVREGAAVSGSLPKSVILVGHSMGGFVARAAIIHPHLRKSTVETILTLSSPHQSPPVALQPSLGHYYARVNQEWKKGYVVQTSRSGRYVSDPPLSHIVVVSISGGINDYQVRTKLESLDGIVPPSHGFLISSTAMKNVWLSMEHQVILWCNQLVVQVSHTLLSLIDPEAGQPFSDTQKRLAAFTKMLHSGMPLSSNWLRQSLLPQQATHDPVQDGKKITGFQGHTLSACPSNVRWTDDGLERDLYIQTSTVTVLAMDGRRRWLDIEKLGSNGKGHFVLVTNLVPCSGIRLHLWPEKGKSASDLPVGKRGLEVTQKMVHIPSGPAPRQIEPGSQTEQAPPSAVFLLAPGDMHGFRFLTISVAPSPTVSGRPPPAASMAVGQFFSPKDGELELSPQLLLLSTYSPKDIILKEDHPLAFNMSFAISLGLFPVKLSLETTGCGIKKSVLPVEEAGDLENGRLCKLRCFPPVALAWDATSGLHIFPNLYSETVMVDSSPALWSSTQGSEKTTVLLLVDPHCSYKASVAVPITAAAKRFLLLYSSEIVGFSIAIVFFALMRQTHAWELDLPIPSMLSAVESNLRMPLPFFSLAIVPLFIASFLSFLASEPFSPFVSFILVSIVCYLFANGSVILLILITQLVFYVAAVVHVFIKTRWQLWEGNFCFGFFHWFLNLSSSFLSFKVVRVLRVNPLLVTALVAFTLVCFVHPALGMFILLLSHALSCHSALSSHARSKESSDSQNEGDNMSEQFAFRHGDGFDQHLPLDDSCLTSNPALRARLMSIFCRSITAANSFPSTLQCIFGCIYGSGTTSRLRQMGMEFTVWVFKHAKMDQLKLMGPLILTGILKSLDHYSTSESDAIARDTKSFAYQAIGMLSQRMPQLFRDKIDIAVRLFDALRSEAQFLRLIIQDSTNSLAVAYRDAPTTVLKDLEALLLINSQLEQSEVRFCAVRWATSLFELQHCPSRFICMLGAADTKLDIREMALEGLFPGEGQRGAVGDYNNLKYPKLGDMLDYILKQQPALLEATEMREAKLLFPSKTYVTMIKFLLKCFEADAEQYRTVERILEYWPSVENMCLLLEHAMAYEGSVELHSNASKALITIGTYFQEMIASRYAMKISWLKQFLGHMDFDTREAIARLLGIASHALPVSALPDLISELISSVSAAHKLRFETQHGVLCALGYVTADCMTRTPTVSESLLQATAKYLVDIVNSETATMASVAMEALGHIGLRVPLPLLQDSNSGAVLSVLHEKLTKLLSSDDIKAIQKIVLSLGHMSVNESSTSNLNIALDLIFSLCRSKVEDILFAAGEALSFLWGSVPVTADVILKTNYTSLSTSSNFLTVDVSASLSRYSSTEPEANEGCCVMVRNAITRKLFDDLLYSSKKEERCAGTVWLLSLTMYCGHHPSIQQMLPDIQEAFTHLLGEQNELTQELASQGLSIVYEFGDASMKKNLVNALVGTLTGSGKRKRAVKLVEDSEVFHEGAIGESLSGGKLSTYKELCNLANEMGQPDLIYKFMDLANYQASMNSKRGAAFGFSKIAKQAGDALQPHLRLLIPRLVRYQYDPDKNVQDAMAHIWKSLVEDSKRTIDEHLDIIFDDLFIQCGSRLWRSREASCLALADIIQGRKFDQVEKHLKRIWTAAFRAMDDIKETVRNSGDRLCRAVTSLTTRLCDVSLTETSHARQAMDIVLPFLLTEGIMSKVDNIRKASIAMVMKLAKGAGIAIRPHLSDLVCCMLESLSSLEDQGLNYVELHAANVGIQKEKLENLRISIAKGSPMWETLDRCIDVVDTQSLELLVPRLSQLVRSGVGLNTRVGVASFISLLVQKVGVDIKPFTSILLKLLFPVVKEEKSVLSKRAFANACAIVLKYAAPSQAQQLIEETSALHAGDRNAQISCAILLKSYLSTASDILSGYHTIIVPVIFISRSEDDKNISSLFEELWEENMSSERVTLQLYMAEIVSLICEGIMSSSWASKKKSAQAISMLSQVLGESLSSYQDALLKTLMKELHGRLWEGKDALLNALAALCTSCHKAISASDPATPNAILSLTASACTKKVKKYREAAFCCLEQIIKAFKNPDFFGMVFPLLFEMCNSTTIIKSGQVPLTNDAVKAEADDAEHNSVPHAKVVDCITSCISVGHVSDILEQQKNLVNVISNLLSPGFPWTVKMSVFSLIKELCSRLQNISNDSQETSTHTAVTSFVHELFHSASPKVVECIYAIKIAQVHIAASECLLEMTELYGALPQVQWTEVGFKGELLHQYEVEKNEQAKSCLKKSIDVLESLEPKNVQTS